MNKFTSIYTIIIVNLVNLCQGSPSIDVGEPRIIGGQSEKIEHFPHHVAIESASGYICGGSIIYDKWVLTTASCVKNKKTLKVIYGTSDRSLKNNIVDVSDDKIAHPSFDSVESKFFDIAMLRLTSSIKYTNQVSQIKLHKHNSKLELDLVKKKNDIYLPGFGDDKYGGSFLKNTKLRVAHFTDFSSDTENDNLIVATMKNAAVSGSPLIGDQGGGLMTQIGGVNKLLGVFRDTIQENCYFIRITKDIHKWINEVIEKNTPTQG